MMLKMLQDAKSQTLSGFLSERFLPGVACARGRDVQSGEGLARMRSPGTIRGAIAETLYQTIQSTKIMAPPTNCLSPIGEKAILSGLYKQIKGEFYTAVSRPPSVYRGNPFIIEAGLAFGKAPDSATKPEKPDDAAGGRRTGRGRFGTRARDSLRQPGSAALSAIRLCDFKAVLATTWRNYGISQSRGALAGRTHGHLRAHCFRLGAVYQRVQRSDRGVRRDPQGNHPGAPGMRPSAGTLSATAASGRRVNIRRRNIFELYIEEVVEACNRLKGGKLPKEKLKTQLQRIASSRTGGMKTDETLGKTGAGPEGLPHSIIVTAEGIDGESR